MTAHHDLPRWGFVARAPGGHFPQSPVPVHSPDGTWSAFHMGQFSVSGFSRPGISRGRCPRDSRVAGLPGGLARTGPRPAAQ